MPLPSNHLQVSKHLEIRPVEGGAIVLDTRKGQYAQVNLTAFRLLAGVMEGLTAAEVIQQMSSEFDATPETIDRDVSVCLVDMIGRKWLEAGKTQ